VEVITGGLAATLDLSTVEPFLLASAPAGKPDSEETSASVGQRLVQLQDADGMTSLRVLVQASRVESAY
jgi:hypothetical protein